MPAVPVATGWADAVLSPGLTVRPGFGVGPAGGGVATGLAGAVSAGLDVGAVVGLVTAGAEGACPEVVDGTGTDVVDDEDLDVDKLGADVLVGAGRRVVDVDGTGAAVVRDAVVDGTGAAAAGGRTPGGDPAPNAHPSTAPAAGS